MNKLFIEGNKKIQCFIDNSNKSGLGKLKIINPCIKCINCGVYINEAFPYNKRLFNFCEEGLFEVDSWDTCKIYKYGNHPSRGLKSKGIKI